MNLFNFNKPNLEKVKNNESKSGLEKESPNFTPEQMDEQISVEAEKLDANIEILKMQIDSFGGPEKFKEHFEQYEDTKSHGNIAGKEIKSLTDKSKDLKYSSKIQAIGGTAALGTLVFLNTIIEPGTNLGEVLFIGMNVVWSGSILKQFIKSIKDRAAARASDRIKGIKELQFKMTDTKIEKDQWS